jgi:hypothetical protein
MGLKRPLGGGRYREWPPDAAAWASSSSCSKTSIGDDEPRGIVQGRCGTADQVVIGQALGLDQNQANRHTLIWLPFSGGPFHG